ncbi:MAG TPA: VWA domain-containing protein [Thermoanaerobaculia bacterium]|nr:VWA domain-containing protein [Thermoanaerobaculia bacterium]
MAQTPYIETFEVQLHNLDVVVTDAKGQPVRGLKKSDFVVLENGVSQPITNFSLYDVNATTASSVNAATPDAETFEAVQPPPRHFVFFIDEIEVQKKARTQLYRRVQEFVAAMRDGDVASVVRPTAVNKVALDFTSDRAAIDRVLKQALDDSGLKLTGMNGDIAQLRTKLNRGDNPESAQREYAFASRRRVEHRLGQLRALTSSLGSIEGRKILVMVTMGLGAEPGKEATSLEREMNLPTEMPFDAPIDVPSPPEDSERLTRPDVITRNSRQTIDDIGRSAAVNGVTIYAVEPDVHLELMTRGSAAVPVRAGSVRGGGHFGPDLSRDLQPSMHIDMLQNSAATLTSLSEKTGGKWFRGSAGIDDTFRQMTTDLSTYYSLAYRATGDEGQPRRVIVQVRDRPELRVRTRSEVLQRSTASEMDDLVAASLIYPRPVNELDVAVTAGTPVKTRGYFTVPLDIVVPMTKLTFLPNADGTKYVASFNVHYASAGRERDFMSGGKQEQIVEITPEQFGHLAGVKYRYKTGLNVSHGSTKIAIGLIDSATKLTGFGTVEVTAR